jgi:hypothetical protein
MLEPSPDPVVNLDPTEPDTAMIERIRNMLALVIPDPRGIEIKVRGGVVTLIGQLRDTAQQRAATLITHRVDGVTNVVNKLSIGRDGGFNGALLRRPAARRPKPAARKPSPAVARMTASPAGDAA